MEAKPPPKSGQETGQEKDATPPQSPRSGSPTPTQSPKSGSVTPKAKSDAPARPEKARPTTPPTIPLSPELNPRTSLQRRREKAAQSIQQALEASTKDRKRPTGRRRLPDAPTDRKPVATSIPSLQRSAASLGKRRLNDNPNTVPLGKKRHFGLAGIQEDGNESSHTADDKEMLLPNNRPRPASPDQSFPPPPPRLPQRRRRCTECEDWDHYCSLENNPFATSPCGSCDKRKRFCVEQRYVPRPPGWRAGVGLGIGIGEDEEGGLGGRDSESGSGSGVRMRGGGGGVENWLGTMMGTLLGKLWAWLKRSWILAKNLVGFRMANM